MADTGLKPFFVTGLTRSRTAWWANLLTTDTTLCFHDGSKHYAHDLTALPKVLTPEEGSPYDRIGNSDSSLILVYEEVVKLFPEANWLVLKRDYRAAVESTLRLFEPSPDDVKLKIVDILGVAAQAMKEVADDPRVMTLTMEDMGDWEKCSQAWQHLGMPGSLSPERFALLDGLRISIHEEKYFG